MACKCCCCPTLHATKQNLFMLLASCITCISCYYRFVASTNKRNFLGHRSSRGGSSAAAAIDRAARARKKSPKLCQASALASAMALALAKSAASVRRQRLRSGVATHAHTLRRRRSAMMAVAAYKTHNAPAQTFSCFRAAHDDGSFGLQPATTEIHNTNTNTNTNARESELRKRAQSNRARVTLST